MKHSRSKRLFMALLSVTLLLTACVASVPSETGRASDRSNGLSTGELGALQSAPQGSMDTAVVLPEERETVLELVTTFKTGEDGLFPYFFYWEESGPEHAAYKTTGAECADDKGNIYAALVTSGSDRYICRLNDGKLYVCENIESPISMLYSNGSLYLRLEKSYVMTLDVESGACTMIPPSAYLEEHTGEFLFVSSDGEEPIWLRYDGKERYSLRGEKLSAEGYPHTVIDRELSASKATLAVRDANWTISLSGDTAGSDWSLEYEDAEQIIFAAHRSKSDFSDASYEAVTEDVYSICDQNGNVTSKFKQTVILQNEQLCALPFTQREQAYILEAYHPLTVTLGAVTFEEVFEHRIVCGSDGTLYLLLYYLHSGEVYRILPGYENVTFSELTKAETSNLDMSLNESLDSVSATSSHRILSFI